MSMFWYDYRDIWRELKFQLNPTYSDHGSVTISQVNAKRAHYLLCLKDNLNRATEHGWELGSGWCVVMVISAPGIIIYCIFSYHKGFTFRLHALWLRHLTEDHCEIAVFFWSSGNTQLDLALGFHFGDSLLFRYLYFHQWLLSSSRCPTSFPLRWCQQLRFPDWQCRNAPAASAHQ